MKKFSFFLSCAATALFAMGLTSCEQVQDNPSTPGGFTPTPQTITIQKGDTLATFINKMAETAGEEIFVEIPAGVDTLYTGEITIPADKKLTIAGNNLVVLVSTEPIYASNSITVKDIVIDGEKVKDIVINDKNVPAPIFMIDGAAPSDVFTIDNISFTNVLVKNLKSEFFYANKKKVVVKNFVVENSIIALKGSKKKTMFSFNGGGLPEALTINNSTIYADETSTWSNGGLYSSQSGSKMADLNIESNTISITNSTLYDICKGQHPCTVRQNSAKGQVYTVKNCIIVNGGKASASETQFLVGLNGGSAGNDYNWDVDTNLFISGGKILAEKKIGKTDGLNKNVIEIDPKFSADLVAKGWFYPTNGAFPKGVGDPRWNK